jgi:xanthine/CO dehydrogenase XdhC/CoxF family maturation factor
MDTIGYICEAIIGQFQKGFPVVLASIVSMEGSTPRESGSKMVVARGGSTFGTVGGGLMEAVTIRESNKVLETGTSRFIEFDMTGTDTSSPDMICGGSAVLLLDYLESTSSNLEIVTRMKEYIDEGSSFYFITGYEEADDDVVFPGTACSFRPAVSSAMVSCPKTCCRRCGKSFIIFPQLRFLNSADGNTSSTRFAG